jgi:hypothetical protein
VPFRGGVAGPLRDGPRIPPVRRGAGAGDEGPVTGSGEGPGVGREFLVDGAAVRGGQARRFLHQQRRAPLVQLTGVKGREGVRHFGGKGLRQAQEPSTAGRGLPPGQADLRRDPGAQFRRRQAGVGLRAALLQIEGHSHARLQRSRGGLQVLQSSQLVDQPSAVGARADGGQGADHVRDRGVTKCRITGRGVAASRC